MIFLLGLKTLADWHEQIIFQPLNPNEVINHTYKGPTEKTWIIGTKSVENGTIQQCYYLISVTESRKLICQNQNSNYTYYTAVTTTRDAIGFIVNVNGGTTREITELTTVNFDGKVIFEYKDKSSLSRFIPTKSGFVLKIWERKSNSKEAILKEMKICNIVGQCKNLPLKFLSTYGQSYLAEYFFLSDHPFNGPFELYDYNGDLIYDKIPEDYDPNNPDLRPEIKFSPSKKYLVATYFNYRGSTYGFKKSFFLNLKTGTTFWLLPDPSWKDDWAIVDPNSHYDQLKFITDDLVTWTIGAFKDKYREWQYETYKVDLRMPEPKPHRISNKMTKILIDRDEVNKTIGAIGLCSDERQVCQQFFDYQLNPINEVNIISDLSYDKKHGVTHWGSNDFLFSYSHKYKNSIEWKLISTDGRSRVFPHNELLEKSFTYFSNYFAISCLTDNKYKVYEGVDLKYVYTYYSEANLYENPSEIIVLFNNKIYLHSKN